jgi:hypothetical protein
MNADDLESEGNLMETDVFCGTKMGKHQHT